MTRCRRFFQNILITSALAAMLTACGGQETMPQTGVYKGPGAEDRTVMISSGKGHDHGDLENRIVRLEQDVATLKTDLGQIAISYNGLMTTNERIDSLIAHMEKKEEQAAASVAAVKKAEPKPVAAAPKPESKPAPKKADAALGMRIGEHPGMTRLVIDWTKLGEVKTDLDNTEKLLLVTLSKTGWEGKTLVSGLSSPLVAGWTVDDNNGGKIIAIQLKKPVIIKNVGKLAGSGDQNARVVIDLSAS